jgi:metal-sulfur cluster biosynthetic enzyme
MAVSQDQITEALKECYDPEIPVNIVDLGLIYEIRVLPGSSEAENDIEIVMTMTSPGCPSHAYIGDQVRQRLLRMAGVRDVRIELVWMPAWTPERLSPAARKQLGID